MSASLERYPPSREVVTMTDRYKVIGLPGPQDKYVILDTQIFGYCTLPDTYDPSTLLPLEWKSRASANAWLQRCYRVWRRWDNAGRPVPDNWEPYASIPRESPFADPENPYRYPDHYYR